MSLTLEEFKTHIETIYGPLLGQTFAGCVHQRNSQAVCTGGPRDVINVAAGDAICGVMSTIVHNIKERFEPPGSGEIVWKGILANYDPYQLWVTPYAGDDCNTMFTVANIEVVTGLNWQKQSYEAMVNITVA